MPFEIAAAGLKTVQDYVSVVAEQKFAVIVDVVAQGHTDELGPQDWEGPASAEVHRTGAKAVDWEFDCLVAAVQEIHTGIVEAWASDIEAAVGGSRT